MWKTRLKRLGIALVVPGFVALEVLSSSDWAVAGYVNWGVLVVGIVVLIVRDQPRRESGRRGFEVMVAKREDSVLERIVHGGNRGRVGFRGAGGRNEQKS